MPRPPICRRVGIVPAATRFEPSGGSETGAVQLSVDQLEALRLKDLEGLDQETSARRMGVSRATFHRILVAARRAVAEALVCAKAIDIGGGSFRVTPGNRPCWRCGKEHECCCERRGKG